MGNNPVTESSESMQGPDEEKVSLVDQFLSEFYGLHEFNARRISLLSDVENVAKEVSQTEGAELAEELVQSVALAAPEQEIPRAFRRITPTEMPQIYRMHGLEEARAILEPLIEAEISKPASERNPCLYYNLAYVYQLQARSLEDPAEREMLLDLGLHVLEQAKQSLEQQPKVRLKKGWRPRNTMLATMENMAAIIYLSCSEGDEARASLERAMHYDPNLPDAHFVMGVYLIKQKKFDEAIVELHKALQDFVAAGRELADPWFHLARVYYKKAALLPDGSSEEERMYAEASSCLEHALHIDPDFALAHMKLGMILVRSNCERAVEHFGQALQADPSLYTTIGEVVCPRVCRGCNGVRLKIMLADLLLRYKFKIPAAV